MLVEAFAGNAKICELRRNDVVKAQGVPSSTLSSTQLFYEIARGIKWHDRVQKSYNMVAEAVGNIDVMIPGNVKVDDQPVRQ